MLQENKKEAAQIEQPNKDSNKNSVADELNEMCRKLQRAAAGAMPEEELNSGATMRDAVTML